MNDCINRPDTRLHPTSASEPQFAPCNAGAIHTGRVDEHSAGPHGVAIRLGDGSGIWASLGHTAFRDSREALGEGDCRPLAFEFMFQSLDHDLGDAGLSTLGQFLGEFVRARISDVQDGAHIKPHYTVVKT